jgi:hypothetical protein
MFYCYGASRTENTLRGEILQTLWIKNAAVIFRIKSFPVQHFRVFILLKYFYRIKKSMEHVLDSYRLNYSKYYNYPSCDRYPILF